MIRKFKIEELDIITKIWLETNIKAHSFINEGYWHGNYEMVKNLLPDATVLVYEADNAISGFIGLMDNYIAGIFVDYNNQSKGIGKALLYYAKDTHSELTLHVYKKNVQAVKFYIREKFIILKEQVDENTGEIELIMKWTACS